MALKVGDKLRIVKKSEVFNSYKDYFNFGIKFNLSTSTSQISDPGLPSSPLLIGMGLAPTTELELKCLITARGWDVEVTELGDKEGRKCLKFFKKS